MSSESQANLEKNRNFICSCGKAYLSYAALFTHIKQKHGGKAPGEIIRPRSQNKRGRPRKTDKLASDKTIKSLSHIEFLDNNNLKNNKFTNQSSLDDNLSRFSISHTNGFRSFQQSKEVLKAKTHPNFSQTYPSTHRAPPPSTNLPQEQDDESNMQISHPNNQFSNNTLTMASIILSLQELFKNANKLQQVHDQDLQKFSSYVDLKQYHSQKLSEERLSTSDQKVFLLGNVVCAFLNFCQQTIESKGGYQQMVLLMVCLLDHIKNKKRMSILRQCQKDVIQECLTQFFTQYLDKVIIKYKLNFWILKQNNSFNVIIWFLNWISTIQNNISKSLPTQNNQQTIQSKNQPTQLEAPSLIKQKSTTHNPEDKKQTITYPDQLKAEPHQPSQQSKSQEQNQIQCEFQNFVQQFNNKDFQNVQQKYEQNEIGLVVNEDVEEKNSSDIRPLLEA